MAAPQTLPSGSRSSGKDPKPEKKAGKPAPGKPAPLAAGDPCPNCGGELAAARVPTDEEYAKAFDRENPATLPSTADTASPEARAKLGPLYRCRACGYTARFGPEEDKPDADEPTPADENAEAQPTPGHELPHEEHEPVKPARQPPPPRR